MLSVCLTSKKVSYNHVSFFPLLNDPKKWTHVNRNWATLLLLAGAAVYSSELLLNGIVTQRLEYERLVLF